ncbi:hypothetical protein FRC17_004157 [Serendipita sp. 399]|nr:hypothetical protein FRC17_004157 [Serendipita sp. 399]
MKVFLALQVILAALVAAQDVKIVCNSTLPAEISLSVGPKSSTTSSLLPLRLISDGTGNVSTMVTCSDCGLSTLKWRLNNGVLQAFDGRLPFAGGIYNLPVQPNEQPDFITTQALPVRYPIYCAVPDSPSATTGYLALHGTTTDFYSCENLTPTFAPTDRKDIWWKVDPALTKYPRGTCVRVGIRYKF